MEQLILKLLSAFLGTKGLIGHWWHRYREFRTRADKFKETLVIDIADYESGETTLSAVVLSLFPKHDREFRQLLIYASGKRKLKLLKKWKKYEEVYQSFGQFGVFGVVMAEQPHPDFGSSPEGMQLIERKRKIEILKVINEILEKL